MTGKVAKLMWERRPNFVVHCGDVVDDGASKAQWTGDLFKPCSELFSRVTVFPCIGNHEKDHPTTTNTSRSRSRNTTTRTRMATRNSSCLTPTPSGT
ncbi:metallophosphoesterase [Gemmata palustris]|uniref:metallophosphoesterase n=1 Tax=Gemmata palustris TaxID=2822762 RepID=UPI0036F2A2B5